MKIGKTRSNIRVEIDAHFEILLQMIVDLADHYHSEEYAFDEKVNKIYEEASKYDYETYSDMTQGYGEIQDEYYLKTLEARKVLFCAIFSYCESMLYGIISFYDINKGRTNQFTQLVKKICEEYEKKYSEQMSLSSGKVLICDYYRPLRNYFMHGEINPGKDYENLANLVNMEEHLHYNWNKEIEITDNEFLKKSLDLIYEFLCRIDESYVEKVRENIENDTGDRFL